jgi:site-specific recombinase XerD
MKKQARGPRKEKKLPKILTEEQVRELLSLFNPNCKTGFRDLVLTKFLIMTGCRINEALSLKFKDITYLSDGGGNYLLSASVSKNRKEAHIYIPPQVMTELEKLKELFGQRRDQYLFVTCKGNQLDDRHVRFTMERKSAEMGLDFKLHPHLLRHFFGTVLYKNTGDLYLVQKALRHSHIQTTQIYAHMDQSQIIKGVKELNIF